MSLDRVPGDNIAITQEMIGNLLGVRRESVSEVMSKLLKAGLVEKKRGCITVLDRKKVEKRACECYEAVVSEYERLLPKDSKKLA